MAKDWSKFTGQPIAPAPKAHVPQAIERFESIPEGVKLYTLKSASVELRKRYEYGVSVATLRNKIRSQEFKLGVHYRTMGRAYLLYLPAIEDTLIQG